MASATLGSAMTELKPPGPLQCQVTPGVASVAVKLMVLPAHMGELLVRVGVAGVESTTICTVALSLHPKYEVMTL